MEQNTLHQRKVLREAILKLMPAIEELLLDFLVPKIGGGAPEKEKIEQEPVNVEFEELTNEDWEIINSIRCQSLNDCIREKFFEKKNGAVKLREFFGFYGYGVSGPMEGVDSVRFVLNHFSRRVFGGRKLPYDVRIWKPMGRREYYGRIIKKKK